MKRYFDLNLKTDNNFCDVIDPSFMVEVPNDGKPYGEVNGIVQDISQTPEYIAEQIKKRKDAFYQNFIKTSKGCLRLKTKVGDLIALLPSITLGVQIAGKLNANEIVLYKEPDFTIDRTQEQLEQWLEANQYKNEEMNLQEYMLIVMEITQAIKSLFNS